MEKLLNILKVGLFILWFLNLLLMGIGHYFLAKEPTLWDVSANLTLLLVLIYYNGTKPKNISE